MNEIIHAKTKERARCLLWTDLNLATRKDVPLRRKNGTNPVSKSYMMTYDLLGQMGLNPSVNQATNGKRKYNI
jgi:hypothetical protein